LHKNAASTPVPTTASASAAAAAAAAAAAQKKKGIKSQLGRFFSKKEKVSYKYVLSVIHICMFHVVF
jgi:hypothetical protein